MSNQMTKIKDLTDKELGIIVKYACATAGIVVEQTNLTIVCNILRKEFAWFTREQFLDAFNKNVAGKLTGNVLKPFDSSLNALWVGEVLNAYKEYQRKENLKPKLLQENNIEKRIEYDDKYFDYKLFKQECIDKGRDMDLLIVEWKDVYEVMIDKGEIEKLTKDEYEIMKENVRYELNQKKYEQRMKGNISDVIRTMLEGSKTGEKLFENEVYKTIIKKRLKK